MRISIAWMHYVCVVAHEVQFTQSPFIIGILFPPLAALPYMAYQLSAHKCLESLVIYAGIPEHRKCLQMMSPTYVVYHSLNDFNVIHSLRNFYQFFYLSLRLLTENQMLEHKKKP